MQEMQGKILSLIIFHVVGPLITITFAFVPDYFQIDVFPVWKAWGLALLRMERYAQARVKFKYVLV